MRSEGPGLIRSEGPGVVRSEVQAWDLRSRCDEV